MKLTKGFFVLGVRNFYSIGSSLFLSQSSIYLSSTIGSLSRYFFITKMVHLTENESAFDLLYCITFKLMDDQWLAMRASYMDFNVSFLFRNYLDSSSFQSSRVVDVVMKQISQVA